MNAAEAKKLLEIQCGPETARKVSEAFAAVELERDQAVRAADLYQRVVDALAQPQRHRQTALERDAAAVLAAYFALGRLADDFRAAYSGDTMAQARVRLLEQRGATGGAMLQYVRNGERHGLFELFRLAEVLEGLAHGR